MQKQSHLTWKIIFLLSVIALHVSCTKNVSLTHDPSAQKVAYAVSAIVSESDIISAVAQIDLVTPDGYYPARAVVIIKKNSYLRLELLPPMGPPDFFLTATPQEMKILLPSKGEFYRGEPTGRNLSQFLPWQFNIEDIVAIFAGTYPALTGDVAYLSYPEGNDLRIEMKAQSGISQTVWIGSDGRLRKLERFNEAGDLIYRADFNNYEEGSSIAGKISISMEGGATSITLKYADRKIEKAKDMSIFDLPVPAGFKVIVLE